MREWRPGRENITLSGRESGQGWMEGMDVRTARSDRKMYFGNTIKAILSTEWLTWGKTKENK